MNDDALTALLEKLCQGDEAAAEAVFQAYEPSLRLLVRRMLPGQLRPKFDSMDVVQSVWADLLTGFRGAGWRFNNPVQLRAFLIKVTRNRFIDRVRQNRKATEQQRSLEDLPADRAPVQRSSTPSEVAEADDLWQRMLALCPPAHQQMLHLKREGCSLTEIAQRTGYHESSVRRIFYDLARKVAVKP